MKLYVVTSNPNKVREVAAYFGQIIEVDHIVLDCPEFRHDDVGEIAREKARFAYEHVQKPLIVDDTAFSIEALHGFPGPYAAYVLNTIGLEGILRLMEGIDNRNAFFETAIAFAHEGGIELFRGRIDGVVVEPRGTEGFGYDPIFEVENLTLAERSLEQKTRISHRTRALEAFKEWFESEYYRIPVNANC